MLLETERLALRRFTRGDADDLFELDGDPLVMRFLNGGKPTPREIVDAEVLPRFMGFDRRLPGFGFWAAIEKASGDFVGWFSLRPLHESTPVAASLGFRLRSAFWGQGLATEGAQAIVRVAFTELGVGRVIATTYEANLASRRVLEKIGMSLVRRYRMTAEDLRGIDTFHVDSYELWDGDDLEYSLRRDEWAALRHPEDRAT